MVNVIVARPRTIQVSSNATAGILDTRTSVTLKSSTGVGGVTRLDSLVDVNATGEQENATLVYESNTDTYVVKQIDLDGGNF